MQSAQWPIFHRVITDDIGKLDALGQLIILMLKTTNLWKSSLQSPSICCCVNTIYPVMCKKVSNTSNLQNPFLCSYPISVCRYSNMLIYIDILWKNILYHTLLLYYYTSFQSWSRWEGTNFFHVHYTTYLISKTGD